MQRPGSAYYAIYEDLCAKIRDDIYKRGDRLPTEAQICQAFHVSRVTARKALEMLERDGLIYRKQGAGSFVADLQWGPGHSAPQGRMIAMLLPFSARQGRAMDMIRGASDYLTAQGYYLNVQICEHDLSHEREMLKRIVQAHFHAILFYPISDVAHVEVLYPYQLGGGRIVTLDKRIPNLMIPAAVSDNLDGSYQAVRYLIANGHTRIGYVSDIGINEAVSVRERYLGYRKALFEASLEQRDADLSVIDTDTAHRAFPEFFSTPDADPGNPAMFADFYKGILTGFLEAQEPVTALHTVNDYVALHLLAAARALGVRVPEQLSVVGFDDIELAATLDPPLTTVHQDFHALGRAAARMALEAPQESPGAARVKTIPTRLVLRGSVAPRATGCPCSG